MRSKLTYANVMATLAVVIALAGSTSAVAAIVVSNNNQVAGDTISGHTPPSGKHANLISGSVGATDLSPAYLATVPVQCPTGMDMTLRGGICYEPNTRAPKSWTDALQACKAAGRRLPTVGELGQVLQNVVADQPGEWTDDTFYDTGGLGWGAVEMGSGPGRLAEPGFERVAPDLHSRFRCIATPTN